MKIESRKLEWNAAPRTKMVNENYKGPTGGDKKVQKIQKTERFNVQTEKNTQTVVNEYKGPTGGDKKVQKIQKKQNDLM